MGDLPAYAANVTKRFMKVAHAFHFTLQSIIVEQAFLFGGVRSFGWAYGDHEEPSCRYPEKPRFREVRHEVAENPAFKELETPLV
jgi:hypothetical protein